MKWFKHYTDASNNDAINRLEQEFGYEGYGVYWKIVELCAAKYDGKMEPKFTLNKKKTKSILSLNYKKTESILSLGSVLNLFSVKISDDEYIIEFPKLAEIKDNHTKDLQATSKLLSVNLPLDKNRTEQNREDKERLSPSAGVDEIKNELQCIAIKPDDLINLWNSKSPSLGLPYAENFFTHKNAQDFQEISKCLELAKKTWEEYFEKIFKSEFLTKKKTGGALSFSWALNPDNFSKVMNGAFDNKDEPTRTPEMIEAEFRMYL